MWELSVAEQRYQAVLAVISDGETVTDVAARFGVSRKTVHGWLARYEAGGSKGWIHEIGGAYLKGTATTTTIKGKKLTYRGVPAGRAALVVSKGRGFGTIVVSYNGKVVKRISLAGTPRQQVVVVLPRLRKTTAIVFTSSSNKLVRVDGLVVARR
jgi:hypothetical protein